MPKPRINQSIVDELERMVEVWKSDKRDRDVIACGETLEEVLSIINGNSGTLLYTGKYISGKTENPLAQIPTSTWVAAAKWAYENRLAERHHYGFFWPDAVFQGLREVLPEETVQELLPWQFIDGRKLGPYMRKLVDQGILERIPLFNKKTRKQTGVGYWPSERMIKMWEGQT